MKINDCNQKKEVGQYKKTLVWLLERLHCAFRQSKKLDWLNTLVNDEVNVVKDAIGYLSCTNAPSTNLVTVQEILCESQKIKYLLGLESIAVVFDQALYATAMEIT